MPARSVSFSVVAADPDTLLPAFAALYGVPEADLNWLTGSLSAAWAALNAEGQVLGAAGVRPSPAHGHELMGGALRGEQEDEVGAALAQTAREAVGQVYAFADGGMLSAAALSAAGLREVAAYRLLAGPVPSQAEVEPPDGVRLLPLSSVPDLGTRLAALATYEDRIGHHRVTAQAAEDGAGGYDPDLSLIALAAGGEAVGLCRAAPEDGYVRIDAPGVSPDLRPGRLRRALLLGVCRLAAERGFEHVSVEGWGDTPDELAADLALGLEVQIENPIYAAP
ncbi:hypothetical protein SAMN04488058_11612 [Deinococcus reticulitermitis]|uniref:Uncharacterized protein n=1 Tax=Deinococcus reticulitermitis TaxID=856736 RepID=A0A1H7B5B8_9DEIO|nr:hypothetical protein [Deinococcus reticulitermitis]SEJ72638.1 hypothetical protein SAMN04488058_11612 [Deinococcus reticulitermitis]